MDKISDADLVQLHEYLWSIRFFPVKVLSSFGIDGLGALLQGFYLFYLGIPTLIVVIWGFLRLVSYSIPNTTIKRRVKRAGFLILSVGLISNIAFHIIFSFAWSQIESRYWGNSNKVYEQRKALESKTNLIDGKIGNYVSVNSITIKRSKAPYFGPEGYKPATIVWDISVKKDGKYVLAPNPMGGIMHFKVGNHIVEKELGVRAIGYLCDKDAKPIGIDYLATYRDAYGDDYPGLATRSDDTNIDTEKYFPVIKPYASDTSVTCVEY